MKSIHQHLYVLLLLPILMTMNGCKKMDSYNDPASTDMTKPGMVSNVRVENYSGGAHIVYTLPNSKNILYVLAKYQINNDKVRETKSSYYSDTVTVEGFAKAQTYNVTLYTVSRANVMSDPVVVPVNPTTPPYLLLKPSITIEPDFSGIKIKALNASKNQLGIILLDVDAANNTEVVDQNYSSINTINYSVRGYQPVAKKFGYYVMDSYGNISDTTFTTITPFYENILDRTKFQTYRLPTDGTIAYGWDLPYLWDGKTDGSSNGWHTEPAGRQPMVATFGLGVSAKLSRFVLWARPDGSDRYAYSHGNPKVFSMWGSNAAAPRDVQLPAFAEEGTVLGDWVNLGNYRYPDPPSGALPVAHTTGDNDFVKAGVNFDVPLSSPKTRFVRFCVTSTWSNGSFAHAMELAFYGDAR